MEVVKKNILSIICGVIALLAVTALFWPVNGLYADTQKELEGKKSTYSSISGVLTARRNWPVPNPVSEVTLPLQHFPNPEIIKEGKHVEDLVHKEALEISEQTRRDNEHQTLVPYILPNPGDKSYAFVNAYKNQIKAPKAVDPTKPKSAADTSAAPSIAEVLQAISPPNQEAIQAAAKELWTNKYYPKLIKVGGVIFKPQQTIADWQADAQRLAKILPIQRATQYKMYMDADAIVPSTAMMDVQKPPAVDDIWYAQNMMWVTQDLADSMRQVDSLSRNIMDAPIKQLVKLEIASDFSQYITTAGPATAEAPAAEDPLAKAGKVYGRSPTGRVCNPLYDVVHFTLTINVDAARIPEILAGIQRGKLITIYQANASTVDAIAQADEGYIYGPKPVVKLTCEGEELFLRDWTVKLMPDSIKTQLSIPTTATPAAAKP